MIEVIKHGLVLTKKIKTCPNCGCVFTYSNDDYISSRIGKYINCPDCRNQLFLDNNKL